jgi:hypothetical protein
VFSHIAQGLGNNDLTSQDGRLFNCGQAEEIKESDSGCPLPVTSPLHSLSWAARRFDCNRLFTRIRRCSTLPHVCSSVHYVCMDWREEESGVATLRFVDDKRVSR